MIKLLLAPELLLVLSISVALPIPSIGDNFILKVTLAELSGKVHRRALKGM
jgi:hypothetical protein